MQPPSWKSIEETFHAALERPAGEREAFLQRACGADRALLAEVAAMLQAHADGGALRIEGALLHDDTGAPEHTDAAEAGARVGPWRLLRVLGRGGMGDVWLAERADGAYEQLAALKRVRSGWRPAELLERFRRERQLLARLAHPNIARLLDGGASEGGEPYLAMEYVEGQPITRWCDQRNLRLSERLRLFVQVCEAVRFAHANLVVHRDLKPANILVGTDGRPVLLDFGIAKLLEPDGSAGTSTHADERLLTPEYAAPEQVRGEPVTTATDVWGLGVLLFELLTGGRPFGAPGDSPARSTRRVVEDEPRRPSECAVRLEPGSTHTPRAGLEPAALGRALRGDLDAIVGMALRREPERRYRSAGEFADDVTRHLEGRPVAARPGSGRYRLGRFIARHRAAVVAGAGAIFALLTFGVVATWQARSIAIERDRARSEQVRSERALTVLVDLFRVNDPRSHPGGDTLRVADLLRLAEGRIDQIDGDPLIRARLWEAVASIHGSRSNLAGQRLALARALESARLARDPDLVLRIQGAQAALAARLDGGAVAEPLLRQSLAANERRYGKWDEHVAEAAERLAHVTPDSDERVRLLAHSLEVRRRSAPGGSVAVASTLNSLGGVALGRGLTEEARRYFDESMALTERLLPMGHPDRLLVRHNVAECEAAIGRFESSYRIQADLVGLRRRFLGLRTTAVAASLLQMGLNLSAMGRHAEAADTLAAAQAILSDIFGPDGHSVIGVERHLALALLRAGRTAEAERHLRHALQAGVSPSGGRSAESAFLSLRAELIEAERSGRPDAAAVRVQLETILRKRPRAHAMVAEALVVAGSTLLSDPAHAPAGEPGSWFRAAVARVDSFVPSTHPLHACAHCGDLIVRAQTGAPVDRTRLRTALRACERWGLAPRALLEQGRTTLAIAR